MTELMRQEIMALILVVLGVVTALIGSNVKKRFFRFILVAGGLFLMVQGIIVAWFIWRPGV